MKIPRDLCLTSSYSFSKHYWTKTEELVPLWNTYISCAIVAIYQVCSTLAFLQPDKNSGISTIEQKASLKMHVGPLLLYVVQYPPQISNQASPKRICH